MMGRKLFYFELFFLLTILWTCSPVYNSINRPVKIQGGGYLINSKTKLELAQDSIAIYIKNYFKSENSNHSALDCLYLKHNYYPFFYTDSLRQLAISVLKGSSRHAINTNRYKTDSLTKCFRLPEHQSAKYLATFDRELTLKLQLYAHDLFLGVIDTCNTGRTWTLQNDSVFYAVLTNNLVHNFDRFFEPEGVYYQLLKQQWLLWTQRAKIKHLYKPVAYGGSVPTFGDSNLWVAQLKQRLGIIDKVPYKFTRQLFDSVKNFQYLHGLKADGHAGRQTYHYLMWSPNDYLRRIKVALYKQQQTHQATFNRGVYVNIPAFKAWLKLDSVIYESRVVVGKSKTPTPELQSLIGYLVVNPCWTVPKSIAIKSIFPRVLADSTYLIRHNMFVGLNGVEQDVSTIDLSNYAAKNFPYRVYQRSGGSNALGRVKFMFNNPYSVYLHDTPSAYLFNRDKRCFSHGCVRLECALEWAEVIMTHDKQKHNTLDYYFSKNYPVEVHLHKRIPITINYATAYYNPKLGQICYADDVYGYDWALWKQLSEK